MHGLATSGQPSKGREFETNTSVLGRSDRPQGLLGSDIRNGEGDAYGAFSQC
jgi:hypothetical protein